MPRKIDSELDKNVLDFLKTHTWVETQNHFDISSRAIKLIKDRNPEIMPSKYMDPLKQGLNNPELKKALKNIFDLFDNATKIVEFNEITSEEHIKSIDFIEKVMNQ